MASSTGFSNPSFTSDLDETSQPKISPEEETTKVKAKQAEVISRNNDLQSSTSESSLSLKSDEATSAKRQNVQKKNNFQNEKTVIVDEKYSEIRSEKSVVSNEDTGEESSCTSCCKGLAGLYVGLVVSVLTTAFGIAMVAGGYDAMFDAILQTQMEVKPGSRAFDIWKDTPVPLSLSFYLYNLTNPEEFQNGAKPQVSEVGPYVYREYHKKTNMTFNDNATVAFYQQRWWIWDQEASGDWREDDPICILNTVPVSAAYSVRDSNFLLNGLNSALNDVHETLTPVYTARETLFDGYPDPLLELVHNITVEHPNAAAILEKLGLPPALLDYDKMAWFYKRNLSETYDGLFNMFTGTDTLDHLGNIDRWNTMNETEYYTTPCNGIFGSAGEIWPPYQTATNISFWCSDMCSTLTLAYKEVTTDEFGLEGYRYWADETVFASPDEVPGNICFCYKNDSAYCPPSGLMDAQTCRMGSPAYISFPHFLHGDPSLTAAIDGILEPDEERDQLYIDMIPELGVPMSVRARMQINMHVQPYPGNIVQLGRIDLLANVHEVVMPLLWFEVKAGLTKELANELKLVVFLIRSPTMTIIWFLMVGGGIIGSLFLLRRLRRRRRKNMTE